MAELVLETPEGLTLRHELAGAGSRTAAGLVDVAVCAALLLAAVLLLTVFAQLDGARFSGVALAALAGGAVLVLVGLLTVMPVFLDGRTPGKLLLGLRVVDRRGWPATAAQHFLRALFWPLELAVAVPLPVGLILMGVLPDCQRLGDLVAGTVVLRDPPSTGRDGGAEPFRRERWESLPSRRLDLAPALRERFGGEDLAFLRELFSRGGMLPSARRRLFSDAWHHYAVVLGLDAAAARQAPAEEAAEALRELYLFLRG